MDFVFLDRQQLIQGQQQVRTIALQAIAEGQSKVYFWLLDDCRGLILVNCFEPKLILAWDAWEGSCGQ